VNKDYDIYSKYKPLRNHISQLCLEDSFFVTWAYIQHFHFSNAIPNVIEVIPEFLEAKTWIEKKVFPWEIETIVQELIMRGQYVGMTEKTLRKWSYFSSAVNKLKDLENEIAKAYSGKETVFAELTRIAHRQFQWQSKPSVSLITRYYKIFGDENVDKIVQETIGLTVHEIYIIGMMFAGAYMEHVAINLPIDLVHKDINPKKIDKFLNRFSKNITELKKMTSELYSMDEKYAYSFFPLRSYPIIRMTYHKEEKLVCPLPTLLLWRITSGIYYEICDKKGFSDAFGESFQKYTGDVISQANINKSVQLKKEEEYYIGKNQKHTVDWILFDKESAIFIECKSKRLKIQAKMELYDQTSMEDELGKMADFVVQSYKTIKDYGDNRYPTFPFEKSRRVFPLIVTMEDWIIFGDKLIEDLNKLIIKRFKDNSLKNKTLGEKRLWTVESFLRNQYSDELKKVKNLFEDKYEDIFSDYVPAKS